MKTVQQVLESKTPGAVTIAPDASVFDALELMADKDVGAVVVTHDSRVIGIMSERDYARKLVLMSRSSKDTPLRDVMTSQVMYVHPHQSSEECMALMTQSRLRHLPVLDGGKVVGLISIGDIVKGIISEQNFLIEQLQHYISGDRG